MSRPSRFPRGRGQHKGPLCGADASPPPLLPPHISPAQAPAVTSTPEGCHHPVCAQGIQWQRKRPAVPGPGTRLPHPGTHSQNEPGTPYCCGLEDTEPLRCRHGGGPSPPPVPQQVGAAWAAPRWAMPSWGRQSARCWRSFLHILLLPTAGDRHAQPLTPQGWQASPAAGLRGGSGTGHAGTRGRTWGALCPCAQHGCGV